MNTMTREDVLKAIKKAVHIDVPVVYYDSRGEWGVMYVELDRDDLLRAIKDHKDALTFPADRSSDVCGYVWLEEENKYE